MRTDTEKGSRKMRKPCMLLGFALGETFVKQGPSRFSLPSFPVTSVK